MSKTTKSVKPAKPVKTTRKSTLSKKELHNIYAPAAKIAWISIFQKKAQAAKSPADRKEYLAKMKAQIAKLPAAQRARYRELESDRKAA